MASEGDFPTRADAQALTQAELEAIGAAAEQLWIDTGLTADQIATLSNTVSADNDRAETFGSFFGTQNPNLAHSKFAAIQ